MFIMGFTWKAETGFYGIFFNTFGRFNPKSCENQVDMLAVLKREILAY